MNAINVNQSRWERIPLKAQRNFIWEKGDKCRRGPLIKSSCYTVIFFRALSLTLPFFTISAVKKKKKNSQLLYLGAISSFPLHCHSPYSSRKERAQLAHFFGQSPCSCCSEKRSAWMSNCPQNTMKDWFAALFRALTLLGGELNRKPVSRGWNKDVLSAGKEGKLPI